ncbi:MAG TPA: hypothetical protein VM223_25520, partial [Planctomycetota bacterium]|nr:hypothetical protein [Planctomycetota bacterium]
MSSREAVERAQAVVMGGYWGDAFKRRLCAAFGKLIDSEPAPESKLYEFGTEEDAKAAFMLAKELLLHAKKPRRMKANPGCSGRMLPLGETDHSVEHVKNSACKYDPPCEPKDAPSAEDALDVAAAQLAMRESNFTAWRAAQVELGIDQPPAWDETPEYGDTVEMISGGFLEHSGGLSRGRTVVAAACGDWLWLARPLGITSESSGIFWNKQFVRVTRKAELHAGDFVEERLSGRRGYARPNLVDRWDVYGFGFMESRVPRE